MDTSLRNCLNQCPFGEGPRFSHILLDQNLTIRQCEACLHSSGIDCESCNDAMCIKAKEGFFIVNSTVSTPTGDMHFTSTKKCDHAIFGCNICNHEGTKCLSCNSETHFAKNDRCHKKCDYWQKYLNESDDCEDCRPHLGQSLTDNMECE